MNKKTIRIIVIFVLSLIFSAGGFVLVRTGKNSTYIESVKYKESGSIDYKVCLKNNDFIKDKCLSKDSDEDTFIASLIDTLHFDFNYSAEFDKDLSGTFKYSLKAIITADTTNNSKGNYLTEKFDLGEVKTVSFDNKKNINILMPIDINYDEYNDKLSRFKEAYGIVMDGKLQVVLEGVLDVTNDEAGRVIEKNFNSAVTLPLTTQVVEIPISSTNINNIIPLYENEIIKVDHNYGLLKTVGYGCFGISFILIAILLVLALKYDVEVSVYKYMLKKILRTYDGIIVNVKILPDFSSKDKMEVESFEELIDAHSEVRKPINYYDGNDAAYFYLLSEENAWIYVLKKKNTDI